MKYIILSCLTLLCFLSKGQSINNVPKKPIKYVDLHAHARNSKSKSIQKIDTRNTGEYRLDLVRYYCEHCAYKYVVFGGGEWLGSVDNKQYVKLDSTYVRRYFPIGKL